MRGARGGRSIAANAFLSVSVPSALRFCPLPYLPHS